MDKKGYRLAPRALMGIIIVGRDLGISEMPIPYI
ncbi:hypothetical protein Nhal_2100 [Nitrosococcus halophilus Nc 4]|uniref:Uncharacterized protein n=1 Tax=Nitrosococcus halophilus (strain Nc4) TaxID=472759 RepID=D5C4L7_NITHN|nr:hypothetical protein Nhal_2100 [Nitrosococcus halophilus Nc 4]